MQEDPAIRRGRREALVILAIWLAATIYTVTYCALHAYGRDAESLTFVWGFPDWIFYGILCPWAVCFVLSFWAAYFFIRDDRLTTNAVTEDDDA